MNIRNLQLEDIAVITEMHRKHFGDDFPLPDFRSLQFPVAIENGNGLIMAGGIKSFAEMVVIANKDISLVARRKAYFTMLQALAFGSEKLGYDHLHAFASDKRWEAALKLAGFNNCKGAALYIGVKSNG